jgi:hypothetical protein
MNVRIAVVAISVVAVLTGCRTVPAAPVAPRSGTPVSASEAKTWNIVLELFAERNLPIKNIDRASGFVATDPLGVPDESQPGVDCGKENALQVPSRPRLASYSVFVRGDSTSSTVKAAVHWTSQTDDKERRVIECTTQGAWEAAFEKEVKTRAEGG